MEKSKLAYCRRGKLVTIAYISILIIMTIVLNFYNTFPDLDLKSRVFLSYYPELSLQFSILLIWFLPIWLFQMYGYITYFEFKENYSKIMIGKVGIKRYYIQKMMSSFIIGFSIMLVICVIGFIISLVGAIISGVNPLFSPPDNYVYYTTKIAIVEAYHPIIFLAIHYLIFGIVAGLLMTFINTLIFIIKDVNIILAISIVFWYYFISSKINIPILIQPFILGEYGMMYKLKIFIAYVIIIGLFNLVGYIYIIRRNNV